MFKDFDVGGISRDPRLDSGLDIGGFDTVEIKSKEGDLGVEVANDDTEAQVTNTDSYFEHHNAEKTLPPSKVKPHFILERIRPRLDNNLGNSSEISPARKVKRGSVAALRAKFENLVSSTSKADNLAEKVDVKRLTSSSSSNKRQTTPASTKRRMSRTKVSKKDSIDPHQSKINDFFRGVRR